MSYNRIFDPIKQKYYDISTKEGLTTLKNFFIQSGGVKCSLCHRKGHNKRTCPDRDFAKTSVRTIKPKRKKGKTYQLSIDELMHYLLKYDIKVRDLFKKKLERYLTLYCIPNDPTLSAERRGEFEKMLNHADGWIDEPFINLEFIYYAMIHYKKKEDIWALHDDRLGRREYDEWISQKKFSGFREYILKNKLNTLLFSDRASESEQFAFMDSYFELLEKNMGDIYSLIRVDNYIDDPKPIKFGYTPVNLRPNTLIRGASPSRVPHKLTHKISEDIKLYPTGGVEYFSFLGYGRDFYNLYGSALKFSPDEYTMEQSYYQFPAKGTPNSGTRYIDCFIRCVLNINVQSRLDTKTKDITAKFAKEFIKGQSKYGVAYTNWDLQLDMLRRVDEQYVYGFTQFNLEYMENEKYEVPERYVSHEMASKFTNERKDFLIWSFFHDIDISCRESPIIGSQSYITMICYMPEKGMGHWFNFGYYIDPIGESYYFYSCIQSDEFVRFDTLVDFGRFFSNNFSDIISLTIILKTPRTKKIAKKLSPKAYSDIPLSISFTTEDLSLPYSSGRSPHNWDREDTPINEEFAHGLYDYFNDLTLIIYVSKDHTWKQVVEIIESHPDVLKFEVSHLRHIETNYPLLHLDNMNKKVKTLNINSKLTLINAQVKYHPRVELDTQLSIKSIVPQRSVKAKSVTPNKRWKLPKRQKTI